MLSIKWIKVAGVALVFCFACMASGCGAKGDLYLPDEEQQQAKKNKDHSDSEYKY